MVGVDSSFNNDNKNMASELSNTMLIWTKGRFSQLQIMVRDKVLTQWYVALTA